MWEKNIYYYRNIGYTVNKIFLVLKSIDYLPVLDKAVSSKTFNRIISKGDPEYGWRLFR
jgi:hypothetical protein